LKNKDYSEKKDFVKIEKVEYSPLEGHLLIDVKGFDNDGVRSLDYYLNEELIGISQPLIWDNKTGDKIKDYEKDSIELPVGDDNLNLKKGNHTLKTILEDYKGNKLEDSYMFEVK